MTYYKFIMALSLLNQDIFYKLIKRIRDEINPNNTKGAIENRPINDSALIANHPQMTRTNSTDKMLHEAHIFLGPINPSNEEIEKYQKVVKLFNESFDGNFFAGERPMQDPVLCLNFEKLGYVTVMQSSLYMKSNNMASVVDATHQLAELFSEAGFTVLREKIEATASRGCDGLPYDNDTAKTLGKYYEFHIRTGMTDGDIDSAPTDNELKLLNDISNKYRVKFNTPVPLSYNKSKTGVGKSFQRYLNVRFQCGFDESYDKVKLICDEINNTKIFKVIKVISEYVWYDTFREMDKGWIDFDENDEMGLGCSDGFPMKVIMCLSTFAIVMGLVSCFIYIKY